MGMRARKGLLLCLCLVLSGIGFVSFRATAQESPGGSGMQISPTRTDLSIGEGEQREFTIVVKNVTQGELQAKTYINDFESDNLTGNPRLIVDTSRRTPYSIAEMVDGLEDFSLKPDESKEVNLTINVPSGTAPGAYFSAIRFAAVPTASQGEDDTDEVEQQVALTASIAHLVFIEVPGEVNEQIQLESLRFQSGDKTAGRYVWERPDKAALAIRNLGNGFSRPFGKVTISRFGQEVESYDVNNSDPKAIVLPNSSRTLVDDVENINAPGKYTATALVAYGNGGEVLNLQTSFWYIPLWLVVVILVAIVAIVAIGYKVYRKRVTKPAKRKR